MESTELPSFLYWYTLDGYCFSDCVLSSPPKSRDSTDDDDDDGDENSMVFMLFVKKHKIPGKGFLVFCHPGDKEWRTYELSDTYDLGECRSSLCYFKGKLYIMGYGDQHLEIEIQHGSNPKILSVRRFQTSCNIKYEIGGIWDNEYVVQTCDEMFMIQKAYIPRGVYEYVTNVVISKLDFATQTWVEVTSLDDHVFFICFNARLYCSAKELGFTRGCVYFTRQPNEMSFYKYDLEDKTVMLSLPCPDIPKPWWSPNWFMIPTTNDSRRSKTESMSGDNRVGGSKTEAIDFSPIRIRTSINNDDYEKEDIEETRPWDMLHDDIMWIISSFISLMDYIHLRAVCRNYLLIFPLVNGRRCCSTKSLQATNLSPWMVFPKNNESVYSFINPMHSNENYLMSIPEMLKGSTIRCSKDGWLLMSKGDSVFFYNPFTKVIIRLPDLPDGRSYKFRGVTFSSLPTSPDCVVFATSNYYPENSVVVYISFIKLSNRVWTCDFVDNVISPPNRTNKYFEPGLNSPIFYDGAFYCLDVNGILGVFTILENNDTKWEVLSMVPPPDCGFIFKSYLVEFEGKLLSVLLGHFGKWVRIFRLDMSEKIWVEVENLGRHALFISNTSCIATIAPASKMENKIYFPRLQNEGILFYSLDSGKYHSLESEHCGRDYCNSKENLRCSWILPN